MDSTHESLFNQVDTIDDSQIIDETKSINNSNKHSSKNSISGSNLLYKISESKKKIYFYLIELRNFKMKNEIFNYF